MRRDPVGDQAGTGAERGRTKKLIVAFHFHFSNQAGWKCEDCRAKGLERKRRCGWTRRAAETPARVVWARRGVATEVCPKSYISGESAAWLEAFHAWKRLGGGSVERLEARAADAFLILERELAEAHAEQER